MNITPEDIFQEAKNAYLSEKFDLGFSILRECFEDDEVSDETIINVLNAKYGVSFDNNDVQMNSDLPVDPEYKETLDSVLFDYQNILKDDTFGLITPTSFIPFNVNNFYPSECNTILKDIEKNKNKVSLPFVDLLSKLQIPCLGDFCFFNDKGVFFFKENRKTLFSEVTIINSDPNTVVDSYFNLFVVEK